MLGEVQPYPGGTHTTDSPPIVESTLRCGYRQRPRSASAWSPGSCPLPCLPAPHPTFANASPVPGTVVYKQRRIGFSSE